MKVSEIEVASMNTAMKYIAELCMFASALKRSAAMCVQASLILPFRYSIHILFLTKAIYTINEGFDKIWEYF